jgi:YVTN family beta-propeller protein
LSAEAGWTSHLEFHVLGPLEVLRLGARLQLGGPQQRAVLAILLANSDTNLSVGRLAEALWGEDRPAGFVTSVQTYIFRLRELLEPDRPRSTAGRVLVTDPGGGYRLVIDHSDVDSARFEQLVAQGAEALEQGHPAQALELIDCALGLWRGDVLADLAGYEFVGPVAAPLHELRLSAVECRIAAELALGHHDAALPQLLRLVPDHPLRERLQAKLILALYRSGRQSDALSAYQDLRAILRDELGVDPSQPLQDLHLAVLAHDPSLDWRPEPAEHAVRAVDEAAPRRVPAQSVPPAAASVAGSGDQSRRWSRAHIVLVVLVAAALVLAGSTYAMKAKTPGHERKTLAANSVGQVSSDGSITSAVAVGTNPVGLAYGAQSLWVANRSDSSVWRIDPHSHGVLERVRVGLTPQSIAVTPHDVWVANFGDGTVSRINTTTTTVTQVITVGTQPAAIVAGRDGVWVALSGDNAILRIDPVTGRVDEPIGVGDGPDGIAVDGDTVWVANGRDGTVLHIDVNTREQVSSPIRVGSGPRGIAVSGAYVWVANQLSNSVSRINRSTWSTQSILLGDGPTSVAYLQGAVWVSERYAGALARIDANTGDVRRYALGSSPRGLATDGKRVWVASGALADTAHVGGTLTIAAERPPAESGGIDPAEVYDQPILNAERLVYDGLVTSLYGSSDSQVLVPDLATELPQPSDGRRTYTFALRPGIRYSTGVQVHASDFVLGVRRALTLTRGRADFFAGIKGGQNCIDHHDTCDLSAGVVTDDASGRVTFHLVAPDPEFLYKLCYFVYPTPPGTSLKRLRTPMPGTGPYVMTDYGSDQLFTLRRNPYFHRWSFAAQPDGYPDVFRWILVSSTRAAASEVTQGEADLAWLTPLGDRHATSALLDELNLQAPSQLHRDLEAAVSFVVLHTSVPPFNNVLARRALNYAVDRNRLVELEGGPLVAAPTCQLLPPKFPGYAPYCPYTTGSLNGSYQGPDLAKARMLVAASGTKGMPVTIHGINNDLGPPFDDYIAGVLRQLGYRVSLHEMANTEANSAWLYGPRHRLQVVSSGWIADFPLASNFYYAVSGCGTHNFNNGYCNPQLDARATAATQVAATDPGQALRDWTAIDHALVDDAVVVPATNSLDCWYASSRVGNYQSSQTFGPALSQLWVG